MKLHLLGFFFAGLLATSVVSAQTIKGKIIDENSAPLPGAVVVSLQLPDSTFVESTMTDNEGLFQLKKQGDLISVSFLGYKSLMLQAKSDMGAVAMAVNAMQANEVTVTSRSEVRNEGDKFVLSAVYASPFAKGQGTLDFLKSAPMLNVTDKSIAIIGRKEATVLINGRRTNMSATDVVEMVKNLPAQDVEKIEILHTPGSSYRTSEQEGVVNIILKRSANEGVQSTVRISDNQDYYNSQGVAATFTYNSKKVYLTSGVNFNNNPLYGKNNTIGSYYNTNQSVNKNEELNGGIIRFGGYLNMDYSIDKRSTIGFNLRASFSDRKFKTNSTTLYSNLGAAVIDSTDYAYTDSRSPFLQSAVSANIHYDYKTDEKGSMLKLDADYYHGNPQTVSHNVYERAYESGIVIPLDNFVQSQSTITDYYSLSAGYTHVFGKGNTLRVGLDFYGSTNNNDSFYGNKSGEEYISDPRRSNVFLYDEVVGGAYIQYSRTWNKKWSSVFGLRADGSISRADQQTTGEVKSRNEGGLYPSISTTFSPSDKHRISLSLNTSIHRPSFRILNPFITYSSPTFYEQNDPNLKPGKSYRAMLNYSFLKDYTFMVDYDYLNNNWTEFNLLVDNDVIKRYRTNYDDTHSLSISLMATKELFNKYLTLSGRVSANYDRLMGQVETFVIDVAQWYFSANLNVNVALSKKSKWDLQARYSYTSPWQWASSSYNAANNLSLAIIKVFKNSSVLNFGISNILTPKWDKRYTYQPEYEYYSEVRRFRTYYVSYTMRFGNNKAKNAANRNNVKRVEE